MQLIELNSYWDRLLTLPFRLSIQRLAKACSRSDRGLFPTDYGKPAWRCYRSCWCLHIRWYWASHHRQSLNNLAMSAFRKLPTAIWIYRKLDSCLRQNITNEMLNSSFHVFAEIEYQLNLWTSSSAVFGPSTAETMAVTRSVCGMEASAFLTCCRLFKLT